MPMILTFHRRSSLAELIGNHSPEILKAIRVKSPQKKIVELLKERQIEFLGLLNASHSRVFQTIALLLFRTF